MKVERILSVEFLEKLEAWVLAHCPCMFDDPEREVLRRLQFIVEEEVNRVAGAQRCWMMERFMKSCDQ